MFLKRLLGKKIYYGLFCFVSILCFFLTKTYADATAISGVASTQAGYMVWCCTAGASQNLGGYWTSAINLQAQNSTPVVACGPGQAVVAVNYVLSTNQLIVGCAPVVTATCSWTEATACPYYGYITPQFNPSSIYNNNPPWPNTKTTYPPGPGAPPAGGLNFNNVYFRN